MASPGEVFDFHAGESALLVSVPHDGRRLPAALRARMTTAGLALPDTDWHVARLYDVAVDLGASLLVANYSRYVVDLNRPASDAALYDGQVATGLCPLETFAGEPIYAAGGGVDDGEKARRTQRYWQPYHDRIAQELALLRRRHGVAVLWDAHSIPSRVPRLFDGELPVLNIGTFDGRSCGRDYAAAVAEVAKASDYDHVVDGRFKGGYITRHYGDPANAIHAIQLEIAQRAYMDEDSRDWRPSPAARLSETLRAMLGAVLATAAGKS